MATENSGDVFALDFSNVDATQIDFFASIQDRLRQVGEEFSTFTQSLWGKDVSNFLDASPGHDQMDISWEPVRALGKGSFGVVGLWQKIGRKGEVEDSMAIKETRRRPFSDAQLNRDPRLAKEAAIMQQLNKAEQGDGRTANNILRLRSFKNFPLAKRWRFYLEYAPYGDLHKLLYSYRAWDTYLPEEFLWFTFYSFAKAAVVMDEGPFTDLESQAPIDGSVTHLDLKPENIYLGKPDKDGLFRDYPTIKVGDFGLAELTGPNDQRNPHDFWAKGTEGYKPPEQRCFTAHWDRRPDGIPHNIPRDLNTSAAQKLIDEFKYREMAMLNPGYRFLSAHNVFVFGKLMHDMLKLAWWYRLDDAMKTTTEERYYERYNEHTIPEITTTKKPEYSSSIRDLIRECLHIEIGKRPTPQQLLNRTQEGLRAAVRSRRVVAQEFDDEENFYKSPRVYYMGNEVNHMPLGNAGLPMKRDVWKGLREGQWADPCWQPLLPARWAPQVRNGELVNEPIEEGGPKRERPLLNAHVKRDPQTLERNPLGVIWKSGQPSADENRDTSDRGGDFNDAQEDAEYQHALAQQIRASGTHDTEELPSSANDGKTTRGKGSLERAVDHLIEAARNMAHPPVVPPPGPVRIILNPPRPPTSPPSQQPRPTRKRRRAMGLSIDDNFEEPEGHVVKGHNLRKRKRLP